jgi:hypothetical protein
MPARAIEAKPWQSFSIREPHGRHGLAAAVQKHTPWLDVHIATLVNTPWVFRYEGGKLCGRPGSHRYHRVPSLV